MSGFDFSYVTAPIDDGSLGNSFDPWANTPGGFGAQTAYYQQQAANSYANINNATLYPSSVGYSQPVPAAQPQPQPQYNVFDYGTTAFNPYGGVGGNQIFDPGKYYQQNPDVWSSGADAWKHYNTAGMAEGRPGTWADNFNSSNYLANNPDVYAAGVDPTAHWFQFGAKEGRIGGGGEHPFDTSNYLANNPDVFKAGVDPVQHWLQFGNQEGRQGAWGENPFNAQGYSQHNPDVAAAGMDPIAHWLNFGSQEGRQGGWGNDPFNPQEYLLQNRDVAAAGADPLQHWMTYGYKEGRDAAFGGIEADDWSKYFDTAANEGYGGRDAIAAAYLQSNPDVLEAAKTSGQDPYSFAYDHLANFGQGEGRSIFDAAEYLRENPDVAAAGADPYQHYRQFGQAEGRYNPSVTFNPETYREYNPDVAAAGVNPLQHYWNYGRDENREGAFGDPNDYFSRGYMAGDDPYGYGNPTGVGGSGYGDGFGGYGSAESNPWGLPPGANVNDPKSYFVYSDPGANPWQDTRSAFYNDITSNPDRMYDMAVRGYLELKRDPTGRQGVFEAMFNQKAARPVLDPLRADYFPHDPVKDRLYLQDYANTTATLRNNPELLAKLYGEIGRAYSSNITHGATDWASGTVAANSANRTTETWKSPVEGERYFIKNIPNLIDGLAAGRANAAWLLGIQQQLPDYQWPQ